MTDKTDETKQLKHALAAYLTARAAHRRDYDDKVLGQARTDTYNELVRQLHLIGIECDGWREDAARIAEEATR